jgi:integrase
MASITKQENGRWRAQIYVSGKRASKTFNTKSAAKSWAARKESDLETPQVAASRLTFGEVMDRYSREVSANKRGARPEMIRIERIKRDKLGKVEMGKLASADLADWRDRRLQEVKGSTVRREMEQIGAILNHAVREWEMLEKNPISTVRRPSDGKARDRRPSRSEIERLRLAGGKRLDTIIGRTMHAWLFAIETAMRAGEIANLTWGDTNLSKRFVHLPETKNGSSRNVPLSAEAARLIESLPRDFGDDVFGLTSSQITSQWRKITGRAQVVDLTFHDSRHEAITRLARKIDVLDLARMTGHRDLRQLQRYYNPTATEIAKRLD